MDEISMKQLIEDASKLLDEEIIKELEEIDTSDEPLLQDNPDMFILGEMSNNDRKENELYKTLGLEENEDYIFVNQNFITPPRTVKYPININFNGNKIINMEYIDGYNVLDWAKVIEKAKGIITIDTCIMYMIDKLNCNSEYFYCYARNGISTYEELKDVFSTTWVWLDSNNNKLN